MKIVGNNIYDVCLGCGKIIKLNKRIFGSLHICNTKEERSEYQGRIEQIYIYNKNRLESAK